ncbi:hypothetical protein [Microbulbifer sp. SSSA005]|uniref:hypothetical protein n=1 Tax=Microbulbifer sp. SSSA005 TaxID=3243378 RepID=UPI004039AF0B
MDTIDFSSRHSARKNMELREGVSEVDKLLALVQHVVSEDTSQMDIDARGGAYLLIEHVREKVQALK